MTRLGDVVDPSYGFAFKSADFTSDLDGTMLLRGDNIAQGRLRWEGVKRFPRERLEEFERYRLEVGDVVIAMDRPWIDAGLKWSVVRQADVPSLLVQRVARLRARSGLDQGYLAAIIGSKPFTDYVKGVQTGSAVPHISGSQIAAFTLPELPPITEQRAIARVLRAFDEKIESNRRAIRILEALGQSLLDSAVETDAYGFPVYERAVVLGDLLLVLETGSRPRGGIVAASTGVVSLGAESIQSAGVMATTQFKRVPHDFAASMKRGHLEDGDVLVYKDGGKPGNFVPHVSAFGQGFPVSKATINEHVYRVRTKNTVSQGLLYWVLRSPWMDQEMRKRGTGLAIPGLNSSNFRELPWPVIDSHMTQLLSAKLDEMMAGMLRLGSESLRLAALRDALLPELLAGRVRVPAEPTPGESANEQEHA